jgi:hypothetical protein
LSDYSQPMVALQTIDTGRSMLGKEGRLSRRERSVEFARSERAPPHAGSIRRQLLNVLGVPALIWTEGLLARLEPVARHDLSAGSKYVFSLDLPDVRWLLIRELANRRRHRNVTPIHAVML